MSISLYATVETFDEIEGTTTETVSQNLSGSFVDASDPHEVSEALAAYQEDLEEQGHQVLTTWLVEV